MKFLSTPHIRDTGYTINGRAIFIVVQDLRFHVCPGMQVVVPSGFLTDFASIPWFFWRVLPSTGWFRWAAVLHDYLYTVERSFCTKEIADSVLYGAMGVLPHVKMNARKRVERAVIYHAVHYFGSYPSKDIVLRESR